MWKRSKKEKTTRQLLPVLVKFNAWVRQKLENIGGKLNRRTAHWQRRHQVIFLLILCSILAGVNLLPTIMGSNTTSVITKETNKFSIPRSWQGKEEEQKFRSRDSIAFLTLRHRLDSMLKTEGGRAYLKAFNERRPGLLDSILLVERQVLPTLPAIEIPPSLKTFHHD